MSVYLCIVAIRRLVHSCSCAAKEESFQLVCIGISSSTDVCRCEWISTVFSSLHLLSKPKSGWSFNFDSVWKWSRAFSSIGKKLLGFRNRSANKIEYKLHKRWILTTKWVFFSLSISDDSESYQIIPLIVTKDRFCQWSWCSVGNVKRIVQETSQQNMHTQNTMAKLVKMS